MTNWKTVILHHQNLKSSHTNIGLHIFIPQCQKNCKSCVARHKHDIPSLGSTNVFIIGGGCGRYPTPRQEAVVKKDKVFFHILLGVDYEVLLRFCPSKISEA